MRNIKLTIAYDGTDFHGFQRQPELRTVQGTLEETLQVVLKQPVSIIGSGRTDAGVHAKGQVVNFHTASG
ncbi:MAG: tRNA pseudouridine(38-40) synthase TruA, partial [Tumebacillaceae bacterium]